MQGLDAEAAGFLTAVLSGMTAICAYRCMTRLREVFAHPGWLVEMEDGIYWLGTGIYFFGQIYRTNSGVIRWYFLLGAGAGVFLFRWMEEKRKKWCARRIVKRRKNSAKTIEIKSEKR